MGQVNATSVKARDLFRALELGIWVYKTCKVRLENHPSQTITHFRSPILLAFPMSDNDPNKDFFRQYYANAGWDYDNPPSTGQDTSRTVRLQNSTQCPLSCNRRGTQSAPANGKIARRVPAIGPYTITRCRSQNPSGTCLHRLLWPHPHRRCGALIRFVSISLMEFIELSPCRTNIPTSARLHF